MIPKTQPENWHSSFRVKSKSFKVLTSLKSIAFFLMQTGQQTITNVGFQQPIVSIKPKISELEK